MKKIILLWIFLLTWSAAQAQDTNIYFSVHGALKINAIFDPTGESRFTTIPLPAFQLGFEIGDKTLRGGLRFTSSGLFPLFGTLASEIYIKYLQTDNLGYYGGIGYTLQYAFLSGSLNTYHALFGIEIPGGWHIELTPGFATGAVFRYIPLPNSTGGQTKTPPSTRIEVSSFVFGISIGWGWKF